ncbi:MAG: hypothetical protein LLG01_00870 [Planctomycetaceae bacterium]|nr:hypothetical protein [Planctomycetaceae bacterium]
MSKPRIIEVPDNMEPQDSEVPMDKCVGRPDETETALAATNADRDRLSHELEQMHNTCKAREDALDEKDRQVTEYRDRYICADSLSRRLAEQLAALVAERDQQIERLWGILGRDGGCSIEERAKMVMLSAEAHALTVNLSTDRINTLNAENATLRARVGKLEEYLRNTAEPYKYFDGNAWHWPFSGRTPQPAAEPGSVAPALCVFCAKPFGPSEAKVLYPDGTIMHTLCFRKEMDAWEELDSGPKRGKTEPGKEQAP